MFLIAFTWNYKSYIKSHLCLHYTFLISFNTARESDKSYMINHSVFWPLKTCIKKKSRCKFKIDTTTYSKSQSTTTYEDSKNKPSLYHKTGLISWTSK